MPAEYIGDPDAAESPGIAPGPGVAPDYDLPVDADALNAASTYQPWKTSANYIAFLSDSLFGGKSIKFGDEFLGNDLDTHLWQSGVTGSGSAVTVIDDNTNGGAGALQQTLGASGGDATVFSRKIPIGIKDFYVYARARKVTTPQVYKLGLSSVTAGEVIQWGFLASGNWFWYSASGTFGDSGVAFSTTYQTFEIRRSSGVLYFYIDGTLYHSVANVVNIAAAFLNAGHTAGAANAGEVRLDAIYVAAKR